jgi:hypothetical protein
VHAVAESEGVPHGEGVPPSLGNTDAEAQGEALSATLVGDCDAVPVTVPETLRGGLREPERDAVRQALGVPEGHAEDLPLLLPHVEGEGEREPPA